jgi:hypothetical protein
VFTLLFRNRWFALAWVGLTLASVSLFVGKDGGADRLTESAAQVRAQREMLERVANPELPSSPGLDPSSEAEPPLLRSIPGSAADPANPQAGDVFIDPATGRRIRAVRRDEAAGYPPAFPGE